jgi:hypothetical protein
MFQNELMATGKDGKPEEGIEIGYGVARFDDKDKPQDFRAVADIGEDVIDKDPKRWISDFISGGSNDLHGWFL